MARMRRALAIRPVHTKKHYVTLSGSANANAISQLTIAAGDSTNNRSGVERGAHVKNIYLEFWVSSHDTSVSAADFFAVMVAKYEAGDAGPTATNLVDPGGWHNRKNILFYSRGLHSSVQTPVPVLRNWIKIPRGKSRLGEDDVLALHVTSNKSYAYCGFTTYKEYS